MTSESSRPWLASYAKGVPAEIPTPDQPIHCALERAAQIYPKRAALEFMGRATSYAKLSDQVSRAAEALRRSGVGRGTVVAIALPNCPQHVVAFHAVLRLGGIVAEHNPTYTASQFAHQLADCGASYLIAWDKALAPIAQALQDNPGAAAKLKAAFSVDLTRALPLSKRLALRLPLPKTRLLRQDMTVPGASPQLAGTPLASWDKTVRRGRPLPDGMPGPAVADIALLQYTGGTSGVPKGAILTHSNLVSNAVQSVSWVTGLRQGEEIFYAALPFFHAFGLNLCLVTPPFVGATTVVFPKFSVDLVLSAHKRAPATLFPGVPPMFDRLEHAAKQRGVSLRGIRYAISGAMAIDPDLAARWEAASGGMMLSGYGLTETSPIISGDPVSDSRRRGCIGLPYPSTEVKVTDPGDPTRQLPPGQTGELLVRGPQVFAGYWNSPAETAAVLLQDGWFRTGDLVTMEPGGFLRLVDRIKEVIVTGGFKVYPSEVEQELALMPEILEVAVVGMPGGDLGERVAAAVVLAPGAKLELEQVVRWCRQRLSRYAIPRELFVLPNLPRSQIGKALRRLVRQQLLDGVANGQRRTP